MKVQVKFIKGYSPFIIDDITQLEKDEAKRLAGLKVLIIFGEEDFSVSEEDLKTLPDVDTGIDGFVCPICGKSYKTERGLKSHKTKAHKIK